MCKRKFAKFTGSLIEAPCLARTQSMLLIEPSGKATSGPPGCGPQGSMGHGWVLQQQD